MPATNNKKREGSSKALIALTITIFIITLEDSTHAHSRKGAFEEDRKSFSSRMQDTRKGESGTLKGTSISSEEVLPSQAHEPPSSGGGLRLVDVKTLQPKVPPLPSSPSWWGQIWRKVVTWFGK